MKWLMLVLLLHLLLIFSKCNKVINITSQDHLLQLYLCHHYNYTGDTTLLLLDTVYNISGNGSLCNINTNYSLIIQGNHTMATIKCISSTYVNTTHPTIGFAFTGSSSVTLQRVTFIGCGANLTTLDKEQLDIINSTSSLVYFTQYHAAVLVFTEISYFVMRDVSISQYYGFAIVAVNLPNGNLDSIKITGSRGVETVAKHKNRYSVGSGVLLMYQGSPKILSYTNQYKLIITNSIFSYNFDYIASSGYVCVTDLYNSSIRKDFHKPVINDAGLTIFNIGKNVKTNIDISHCKFSDSLGSIAGAILVLYLNSVTHSQIVITNSKFDSNGSDRKCHGSGLVLFFDRLSKSSSIATDETYCPLQLVRVQFTFSYRNVLYTNNQLGVVFIAVKNVKEIPMCFKFSHVIFKGNQATISGSCIYAVSFPSTEKNKISFLLESIKAYINGILNKNIVLSTFLPASLFKFLYINSIIIKGSSDNPSNFSFNFGTVIQAIQSDITLEGHILFNNNTGINGGAIMLIGDSLIHLTQGLRANFTNNKALSSGGAIYDLSSTFDKTHCTFQVNITQHDDIAVLFENNKAAVTGNSVFSPKLYDCLMCSNKIDSKMVTKIYNNTFIFISNDTFQLSTTPIKLVNCHSCTTTPYTLNAYPGQTINFSVAAIDAARHHSYSIVNIAAVRKTNYSGFTHINWWFSEREDTQVIRESDNCTVINITIHTNDISTLDTADGVLLLSIPSIVNITVVNINLKSCPPGFELSLQTGSCICSHILSSLNIVGYTPNCSINTITFNRPIESNPWAGISNEESSVFLFSSHCPHGYCNSESIFNVFQYKNNTFALTTKDFSITSSLCLNNREGILCSKCSTVNGVNYSVVFGSTKCRQCSNWWLWTIVLYALAGFLLIYLLYALRLTLATGTINGIIFYVQVANAGLYDVLSSQCYRIKNFAMFFISIMNLNLGFPLCFYNGMTEFWKAGLNLLFPLYLLIIVVVLIILSRFSLRLSNRIAHSSVQVLVTVVHLSFSKLLIALFDTFIPVELYNSTMNKSKNIWFYDGSVTYGDANHMKLMIVTSVIVGIFLIPYMLIILTGRLLMRSNKIREYLRPIYEAIHAPYKYNKQYWFTARQLLLIFEYIMYTIYRGSNILLPFSAVLPIYLTFVTVQAHLSPFKNKVINILDLSVMINYGMFLCTNWYLINEGHLCTAAVFDAIFVYIMMFIFSVVVFYHIVLLTGQQARFIGYINAVQRLMKKLTQCLNKNSQPVSHSRQFREDINSSFFDDSYSEYREPLMSP